MSQWQVPVAGGKYRLVMGDDGVLRAWRNGQPWPARDLAGDGLVLALAQDLRDARGEAREGKLLAAVEAIFTPECWGRYEGALKGQLTMEVRLARGEFLALRDAIREAKGA